MPRFLLGINYWPRRSAMYMWQQFDLDEIGEDMARIKALGLDIPPMLLCIDHRTASLFMDSLSHGARRVGA